MTAHYKPQDFSPKYKPWKQRLCIIKDGDLFKQIRNNKVEIITDTVKSLTPKGISFDNSKDIKVDLIVSATGLKLQTLGGIKLLINNKEVNLCNHVLYRGILVNQVPNFAISLGYTNASWTLKSDLNSQFIVRLLNKMRNRNQTTYLPQYTRKETETYRVFNLEANYLKRNDDALPKTYTKYPWASKHNHFKELLSLKYGRISNKDITFS